MERFLIALDCSPNCLKVVEYVARILNGDGRFEFMVYHILPTTSPDKLRRGQVERIESIHPNRPDLAGYFWRGEDEQNMERCFSQAKEVLVGGGFQDERISFHYGVESGDLADIIIDKAVELRCTTIVLGRKQLSRVKEFFLGSVSSAVLKMSRGIAVWVIEI
jgi:nucleotide-binding universal stress UspA family protein